MLKILIRFLFIFIVYQGSASAQSDTSLIKTYLKTLTKTPQFRNHTNIDQLNLTADYIKTIFEKSSDSVSAQEYHVDQKIYKNIICSFGTENKKRIIVGAHYDVCGDQEGADDNASGIVGLMELSRLLKGKKLNYRIDLVAYTLEEPPYFRTEFMGSYIHAKSLKESKAEVFGMISLEMIAYFKDEAKSQSYPLGILSVKYGNKGNYITLVKKFGSGEFVNQFSKNFKASKSILTKTFASPPSLPGIDFSDHLNYWKFDYDAMMITDTSFYRNKNYHQKTDTMETLDIPKMSKVIDGVYNGLISFNP
ncbi:M28 family peptidase [Pedobacter sp. MR2016-19]|uniref:M28 family peptidase n=1 Tax=Pedobacter sp. MR2016-19 TaxID=2780089 RepID=UPI0018741014|nr:M28 family peptidase [Pedobacter sp. MR2016-19]MBE5320442.1 M28 family peptidase [Pedobacter sp. MR2016-19]